MLRKKPQMTESAALPENTRPCAVAGGFYPGDPEWLRDDVDRYLHNASGSQPRPPKGLIAPHAGYMYSGPIAGSAFASVRGKAGEVKRVVLMGPSHYADFHGLALSGADAFDSPLGLVTVDTGAEKTLSGLPQVQTIPEAHENEHCLEVELPFLQRALGPFQIIPLLARRTTDREVCEVIEALWGGPETLFVISSDLSHYLDYHSACDRDRRTADKIEQLDGQTLDEHQACGFMAIRGWLLAARAHGLEAHALDLRNSGDTAGRRDRVVGYGAFAFG